MDAFAFWYHYQLARFKGWLLPSSYRHYASVLKTKKLLNFVKSSIPYYQDFSVAGFSQLPVIDKSEVQDNFEKLNTLQIPYARARELLTQPTAWHANQSVGTSGVPGVYLFSAMEKRYELASILSKLLSTNGVVSQKVAVFYLTNLPYFSDIKTRCFQWRFFDLQLWTNDLLKQLKNFSPDVVVAPVQTLCNLAQLQIENKIAIQPKKIVAVQEVLTPIEERLISSTFKQNVHQVYQCAEGFLGSTCEMGTLHLNEDQYYIEQEWIDEKKEKFMPVITSLNRFVQPLIRYRMNDILSVRKTPCPCGSSYMAIDRIVGRCEDMLYFQKFGQSSALKPIYSDEIHLAIARASGGIEKYQVIQYSPLQLEIKVKAKNSQLAKHCILQQLEKLMQQCGVRCPFIEFTSLDHPPLSHLFRQTMRLAKMPI